MISLELPRARLRRAPPVPADRGFLFTLRVKCRLANRPFSRTALADVQSLRDDLQPWAIGFKELRSRSLEKLQNLWGKANEALALLNQNAAGGASGVLVHRKGPTDALDNWFLSSEPCRPAAVCGPEGHGKTWAALDWLIERQDAMPIVLPRCATTP